MTTTRITTRAAQLVLLGGLAPEEAVAAAAAEISAAPAAVSLARAIVTSATREGLRVLAGGAR